MTWAVSEPSRSFPFLILNFPLMASKPLLPTNQTSATSLIATDPKSRGVARRTTKAAHKLKVLPEQPEPQTQSKIALGEDEDGDGDDEEEEVTASGSDAEDEDDDEVEVSHKVSCSRLTDHLSFVAI